MLFYVHFHRCHMTNSKTCGCLKVPKVSLLILLIIFTEVQTRDSLTITNMSTTGQNSLPFCNSDYRLLYLRSDQKLQNIKMLLFSEI